MKFSKSFSIKKLWILKKHDKIVKKVVIAIETIEKKIKKHDLINKFFFSIFFVVKSIFKSSSTIIVSNSKKKISKFFFNFFVFIVSLNNSSKRKKSKNKKTIRNCNRYFFFINFSFFSSSREFTFFSKTIKTRKIIEFKKWKSKFHQLKFRRQRDFTFEIIAKKFIRKKKNKTNLRNVQIEKMKNRKSQQKRIVNSTFIVN